MEYIPSTNQQALSRAYRLTAIIVLAFGLSTLIYLLTARLIPIELQPIQTMKWRRILYSAALLIGFAVVLTRRILMSRTMLDRIGSQGIDDLLNRLMMNSIVCAALSEIVGVLGLVGYFMTGDMDYSWRLSVISLMLIAYSFPRRGEWVRVVAAREK